MYNPPSPSTFRVLTSAARTATNSTGVKRPPKDVRGVRLFIEVTAAAATPSVVFTVEVQDPLNNKWHSLLASAAVTAISSNCYEVGPGVQTVANVSAARHIGRGFRVTATHADADSITYNIVGEWLP
jgi:hypothetical protein